MKKFFIVTILISATITNSVLANQPKKLSNEKEKIFVENLLEGISSENSGLKLSSAYFLGELKSQKALIPLMSLLKNGETEGERIMAALSLIKLGSERGLFAVKQRIEFDPSPFVRQMCKQFYYAYKNGDADLTF